MATPEVAPLIQSEPELKEALVTVLECSNGGDEELTWSDVRDELTSGQWGRLIQKGVLVDGADGFRLANPDAVEQSLPDFSSRTEVASDASTKDDDSWSKWDKGAGALAVVLFLGYSQPQLRDLIASVDNLVLAPLDEVLPFYIVILTLSIVTGLYSILLQVNLMDHEKMKAYQERMQSIQDKLKRAKEREDEDAIERIQEEQREVMGDQFGMFKLQFKPMVWIMLLTVPIFLWMRWKIRTGHIDPGEMQVIMPLIGSTGWTESALGPMPAWIVWYFLCSVSFRQIIQKSLDLQVSPS